MAGRIPAPVRRSIAVAGGSFFVALALLLDALLWLNATSLRGTVNAADYRPISLEAVADGDSLWLEPDIPEDGIFIKGGVLHIRGALYRHDQSVGAVRMRVGLLWKPTDGEKETVVTLLNTQMVRLEEADAKRLGVDDHCGFHAAVDLERLPHWGEDGQYRVVLIDDTTGCMVDTDVVGLTLLRDGLAVTRKRVSADE